MRLIAINLCTALILRYIHVEKNMFHNLHFVAYKRPTPMIKVCVNRYTCSVCKWNV